MNLNSIKNGMRVKIVKLENTDGIFVKPKHLNVRRIDTVGTILGYVPGHGGNVWWVKHDEGEDIGVYIFSEFEEIPQSL